RSGLSHHQSVPITRRFSTDSSLWPMDRGTGNHRAGWHPAVFLLVVLGLCGCLWPKHAFWHHLLATRTQPELAQSHHSVPCLRLIRDPMVSRRMAVRAPDAHRAYRLAQDRPNYRIIKGQRACDSHRTQRQPGCVVIGVVGPGNAVATSCWSVAVSSLLSPWYCS